MASANRKTIKDGAFLRGAMEAPRNFGLFALVRGIAARAADKPAVGESKLPSQDIVKLRQIPHFRFPGSTIEAVNLDDELVTIDGYWLGLTGPMSPLPFHMSEYAMLENKYAKARPFSDFLDLLAGRFLQFFYRAWAESQPAVHADRPETDLFAFYLGQLTGASDGADPNSAFSSWARLHYAGLFASPRSAGAIKGGLSHLLDLDVELNEFQPIWRDIETEDQTRLGTQFSQLGEAVLGKRTLQCTDSFEIKIIAEDFEKFKKLLPSGELFRVAAEALSALAPSHLDWKMTLCVEQSEIPPTKLDGRTNLGWSSWIGKAKDKPLRSDVHIRRSAMASY